MEKNLRSFQNPLFYLKASLPPPLAYHHQRSKTYGALILCQSLLKFLDTQLKRKMENFDLPHSESQRMNLSSGMTECQHIEQFRSLLSCFLCSFLITTWYCSKRCPLPVASMICICQTPREKESLCHNPCASPGIVPWLVWVLQKRDVLVFQRKVCHAGKKLYTLMNHKSWTFQRSVIIPGLPAGGGVAMTQSQLIQLYCSGSQSRGLTASKNSCSSGEIVPVPNKISTFIFIFYHMFIELKKFWVLKSPKLSRRK